MDIEQLKNQAIDQCIDIANDYTEEEVKKFFPPSVQKAWQIGNEYIEHALKQQRKQRNKRIHDPHDDEHLYGGNVC